jgi:hypothetical protein
VPKAQWSDVYATRLTAALAYTAPSEARFRRTGRFGRTTIYLVPEPERAFAGLIRAVATAFPEYPPYGGAFSEVLPHLTLAHGVPEAALDAVESTTYGRVDVRIEVSGLALFFLGPNGRWTEGSRVPLARQGLPGAGT